MGKHLEQALPSVYTLQCLTGKVDNNNNSLLASDHTHREWRSRVWNVVGEAVEEELLPYKELFTTVVLEQVLVAAATSCFHVCSSCHSCYGRI